MVDELGYRDPQGNRAGRGRSGGNRKGRRPLLWRLPVQRGRHPQGTGPGQRRWPGKPRKRPQRAHSGPGKPGQRDTHHPLRQPGALPSHSGPASDIHFEPFEDEFKIRYRVDGALYEMSPPPKHLALPVISRIKVMSNLDISERRIPQDGRIAIPSPAAPSTCASRPSRPIRRNGRVARARPRGRQPGHQDAWAFPRRCTIISRGDPAAQRHLRRHRPHRLRQNHHPLFLPARRSTHRHQTPHRRRTRSNTTSRASCRWRSTSRRA